MGSSEGDVWGDHISTTIRKTPIVFLKKKKRGGVSKLTVALAKKGSSMHKASHVYAGPRKGHITMDQVIK